MNRYIAAGLLAEVEAGRRVLVVSRSRHTSHYAFDEVAATAGPAAKCRRAFGRERVTLPEGQFGWIDFGIPGRDMRGRSADVVYLDEGTGADPDTVADAALIANPHGEVVRA